MELIEGNVIVRVAVPLNKGTTGVVERAEGPFVVLTFLDGNEFLEEFRGEDGHCGWVIYWYHPRYQSVGLLGCVSPLGRVLDEPFGMVWNAVFIPPVDKIRAAANAFLANARE